jgi:hypothetical protein
VQLTCQTLQKKIVDTEKDKAEKIKGTRPNDSELMHDTTAHDDTTLTAHNRTQLKRRARNS